MQRELIRKHFLLLVFGQWPFRIRFQIESILVQRFSLLRSRYQKWRVGF